MKSIDSRALKILIAYSPIYPEETSQEDFAYAKKHGLMFDLRRMSHDAIVAWAIDEFAASRKSEIVRSFFIGLGLNEAYLRSAISAYAVMTNFPQHKYTTTEQNSDFCAICGMMRDKNINLSFLNKCRWTGSLVGRDPSVLAFYLQQGNKMSIDKTKLMANAEKNGVYKFIQILELIASSLGDEKPSTLYKKIKKIPSLKMSTNEARYLLDALGYCGILQTSKHVGFIYKYTGHLSPSKSRSSDWGYPVDFWTGMDGVNFDALDYWFSDYPEIMNWKSIQPT